MKDLPISRFMASPLTTIAPGDTVLAATALMERRGVHHLLVMDGERMAGILSSADLLKIALLAPTPADALDLRVRDVMQSRVAVLRETATLRDAARALSLGGFHALPVLAADDTPIGMVTSTDLVGILVDQIEKDAPQASPTPPATSTAEPEMPRLLEVLRAADVYLHSGQSDQQHARLVRAVSRAREISGGSGFSQRL